MKNNKTKAKSVYENIKKHSFFWTRATDAWCSTLERQKKYWWSEMSVEHTPKDGNIEQLRQNNQTNQTFTLIAIPDNIG